MGRFFAPKSLNRYYVAGIALLCCHALYAQNSVPNTNAVALNGRHVALPRDLAEITVVIVGFTRGSADATTAWEIPVRKQMVSNHVNLFDLAILESVPGFMRGWVLHSLRGKVPPVLQPRFLPVFEHEKEWKQICGFDPKTSDAAYVLLTAGDGKVLWKTHESFNERTFAKLESEISKLDSTK